MVILTRLEESIKARLCFKFQINHSIHLSFPIHSLHKQFFHIDFWVSLNFFFFFLCQKLSKVFWFSKPWKLVLFILFIPSPFAKKNSPRTNRLNSFCVSLLPFPKEQRTNLLNSFVSPLYFSFFSPLLPAFLYIKHVKLFCINTLTVYQCYF